MILVTSSEKVAECTARTIAWLHDVWQLIEHNRVVQPDPFYKRNKLLTEDVVTKVITDLECIFITELKNYAAYHRKAQGISSNEYLVPPGFDKLPYPQQLAVVQGIDKIFQDYREESAATYNAENASGELD
jgi:hypothetical protein